MINLDERRIRQKEYESQRAISPNEMPRDVYLSYLSIAERENLVTLFKTIFQTYWRASIPSALLAIGSSTYDDKYWFELKKYLQENDPSKLGFVRKRGQDIDLMLVTEFSEGLFDEKLKYIKKDLERQKIEFEFSEERREDGTLYLTVPKDFERNYGRVYRQKSVEYKGSNFIIYFNDSRSIHLSFQNNMPAELKIKYDSLDMLPFSILFRHGDYYELEEAVKKANKFEDLFSWPEIIGLD